MPPPALVAPSNGWKNNSKLSGAGQDKGLKGGQRLLFSGSMAGFQISKAKDLIIVFMKWATC